MKRVNVEAPEFKWDDDDPEGFRAGMARLGPLAGGEGDRASASTSCRPARRSAPTTTSAARRSGCWSSRGTPTLRTPDGEERLGPWDVACFPRGPEGAHGIRNDGEDTARVLMFSTVVHPTATVYPDSDKVGIWAGDAEVDVTFRRSAKVGYYDGEG